MHARLSLQTLIKLRGALLCLVAAVDAVLLEAYGYTPRGASRQTVDG